jgi:fluoride ion exporter CrcB/FEX
MLRWQFVFLLALQAHFAASYLVPLDEQAQREFGGLLRWAWPWAIGDHGPLGRMTATGFPLAGFFLAVTAATVLGLAALALLRTWVPFDWWRALAITGAVSSLCLMALFLGSTKLLPMATALAILAAGLGYWSPMTTR